MPSKRVTNSTAFERFTNFVSKETTKANNRETKEDLDLNTVGDPSRATFKGHVKQPVAIASLLRRKEIYLLCTGMQLPLS